VKTGKLAVVAVMREVLTVSNAIARYPLDELRGVSPAIGSAFCAQCAADPGDDSTVSSFCTPIPSGDGALRALGRFS
jgi:hypothetical protein